MRYRVTHSTEYRYSAQVINGHTVAGPNRDLITHYDLFKRDLHFVAATFHVGCSWSEL